MNGSLRYPSTKDVIKDYGEAAFKKSFSHGKKVLHGKNVTNERPPFWSGLKSVDLVS